MKLIPYFYFGGNAEEALNFYKDVFDGDVQSLSRFKEGPEGMAVPPGMEEKLMHAGLQFGDDCVMYFSDSPEAPGNSPHSISVDCDSVEMINGIYERLKQGGQIHMPLDDQFWGARYAKLTDKFGVNWDLNHFYPQES